MAVNKNFVVKNGLEVNDNLLVADVDTQKVGIGTSVSSYELHVSGGIGATDLYVCGVTTLGSAGGITTTGGDLYIGGDLYVQDDIVYDEQTARNLNVTGIATIATLVGYSSEFSGAIGFSSQTSATDSSTLIGAAVTTINFIGGGATAHTSADNSTVNVTLPAAGASIGLAIALGG